MQGYNPSLRLPIPHPVAGHSSLNRCRWTNSYTSPPVLVVRGKVVQRQMRVVTWSCLGDKVSYGTTSHVRKLHLPLSTFVSTPVQNTLYYGRCSVGSRDRTQYVSLRRSSVARRGSCGSLECFLQSHRLWKILNDLLRHFVSETLNSPLCINNVHIPQR